MADHVGHHVAQRRRLPGGQSQRARRARIIKVKHIAPVRGRGAFGRTPLQKLAYGGCAAGPGRPDGVDVIAFASYLDAKVDGAHSALLTDDVVETFQLLC